MKNRAAWVALVSTVIVFTVVASALVDRSTVRSGPAGSSYVTTPEGAAGLYELLEAQGVEVERLRRADADLRGHDALVIIESGLTGYSAQEVTAIGAFVAGGGRLVVGGRMPSEIGSVLGLDSTRRVARAVKSSEIRIPVSGVHGELDLGGVGVFEGAGEALPLAGAPPTAVMHVFGAGEVIHFADSSAFRNENLVANGAFLVAAIGRGSVIFDEVRHGFAVRDSTGLLGALPDPVRNTLLLALIPLGVGLVAYGRRLGRPFTTERRFDPARVEFVEAIGSILERTRDPVEATAPTRMAALRMLEDDSPLTPDERQAIVAGPADNESVLIVDRALAKLWKEKR